MFPGSAGWKPMASARFCIDSIRGQPGQDVFPDRNLLVGRRSTGLERLDLAPCQGGADGNIQVYAGHHGHCYQPKQKKANPLALHPPVGLTNMLDDLRDIFHD